jgi:hypothetical protein
MTDDDPTIAKADAILALLAKYRIPVAGVWITIRNGEQQITVAVETEPVEPTEPHPERMN